MRWKKLACGALVLAALFAPTSATAASRPSPWSAGVVDWLETLCRQWLQIADSEAPLDATADEGDPEAEPVAPTTSEPDGEVAPSAEGGPEWDPNGNS